MRPRPLAAERKALHDSKPVQLVDDRDRELGDIHTLLNQRVRPNDDVDLPGRKHQASVVLHALR